MLWVRVGCPSFIYSSAMKEALDGKKRHSDTFILLLCEFEFKYEFILISFSVPTLQQLAMMVVKEFQLSTGVLPIHIRQQLYAISVFASLNLLIFILVDKTFRIL